MLLLLCGTLELAPCLFLIVHVETEWVDVTFASICMKWSKFWWPWPSGLDFFPRWLCSVLVGKHWPRARQRFACQKVSSRISCFRCSRKDMIATLVASSWMDIVGNIFVYIYIYADYICVCDLLADFDIFQVHLQFLEKLQPSSETQRCLKKFKNFYAFCHWSIAFNRQERGCPSIRMHQAYSKSWRGAPRKWG